jgi:hypothetical protein
MIECTFRAFEHECHGCGVEHYDESLCPEAFRSLTGKRKTSPHANCNPSIAQPKISGSDEGRYKITEGAQSGILHCHSKENHRHQDGHNGNAEDDKGQIVEANERMSICEEIFHLYEQDPKTSVKIRWTEALIHSNVIGIAEH